MVFNGNELRANDNELRVIEDACRNWNLLQDRIDYTKYGKLSKPKYFAYKKVIFNPPATIVLWEDGQKSVVKCSDNDAYDYEKGLALCFMKRALGNTSGALNKVLHREIDILEEWDDPEV